MAERGINRAACLVGGSELRIGDLGERNQGIEQCPMNPIRTSN